ncbi:MAG TPA: ABC transporter permease [Candidatus Binataceae bacterium]|nr:ABC transporter permease [Candidatus Binataceae bacterium]
MHSSALRNTWIICKHECFKRVRTRSFLITTFLMPGFLAFVIGIPAVVGAHANHDNQRIVLACAREDLAALIRDGLIDSATNSYHVTIDNDVSPAEHQRLESELDDGRIDGVIWIDADSIEKGRATYERRTARDFIWQQLVRNSVSGGFNRMRMAQSGLSPTQIKDMLRGADVDIRISGVKPGDASRDAAAIITVLLLATVLFITLLSYGVMIMRSVLDEKASRVIEVLLCSATPDELMAGKILGVGAVGLLQVVTWGTMGLAIAAPRSTLPMAGHVVPLSLMIYFGIFYLLGYLLYSAMFAAVGAAFNSTDEAQHWNFVIISPLICACTLITPVAAAPNSTLAVIASLVPFCSPVLMYTRLAVESPPAWQIVLCFAILIGTIYVVQRIATRIYRIGILMYGKRPSVREMFKWLSYA